MQKGEALRFSFLFAPVLAGIFSGFLFANAFPFCGRLPIFAPERFPVLRATLQIFCPRTQRREKFSAPKISVTKKPPAKPSARGLFARAFFRRRSLTRIPPKIFMRRSFRRQTFHTFPRAGFLRGRSFGLFAAQNDFRVNKKTVYVAKTPSRTQKNRLRRKTPSRTQKNRLRRKNSLPNTKKV